MISTLERSVSPSAEIISSTLEKTVMPDLLHLNADSYKIEADAIREKLAALVK